MAETCFDTLSNDDFLSEFHDKMSKTEEGRTFLQKMARFFADLAKQLKKTVQGYAARTNNEMVRELMNDAEMLEHINTRFRELLESAENAKTTGKADGTVKYVLANSNGKLNPRTVTEEDVRNLLEKVKSGEIYGHTYIPIRINTPYALIHWARERRNDIIDNNPIAIDAEKAYQAMQKGVSEIVQGLISYLLMI